MWGGRRQVVKLVTVRLVALFDQTLIRYTPPICYHKKRKKLETTDLKFQNGEQHIFVTIRTQFLIIESTSNIMHRYIFWAVKRSNMILPYILCNSTSMELVRWNPTNDSSTWSVVRPLFCLLDNKRLFSHYPAITYQWVLLFLLPFVSMIFYLPQVVCISLWRKGNKKSRSDNEQFQMALVDSLTLDLTHPPTQCHTLTIILF